MYMTCEGDIEIIVIRGLKRYVHGGWVFRCGDLILEHTVRVESIQDGDGDRHRHRHRHRDPNRK